jgi:UDP-N-acetylglucosamine 1-carboxyvinyltransferase
MHITALRQLGVKITEEHGRISCTCPRGIRGAVIDLPFPSVGATENIMLAAVCGEGETVIRNAAREPEVRDLADFLNRCGGDIRGAGCSTIRINGVKKLRGCDFEVMPDRIAAATFMSAAASTGGEIGLLGVSCDDIRAVTAVFEEMGAAVYCSADSIYISCARPLRAVRMIRTMPYPGFPTDAQAVVMASLATARGSSIISENIFESRYRHVDELVRMGANIKTSGRTAVIEGVERLYGANVMAHELRGGAALVVAALGAEGISCVSGVQYIDRGYEQIERSFTSLGAEAVRNS